MKENIKKSLQNNWLAYVRVSSKDQESNWSPEIQVKQIQEYAKLKNLNIVDYFNGVESSFRPGRKLFGRLVSRLKKERLAGIIFATVDRSSRNYVDIGTFYKLIEEGYHFHFAAENLTTESEQDKVQIYDLWGQATVFSQRLRVKVSTAFDRMLDKGLFPTRAPIGYENAGKGVKVPNSIQGMLVKQAFEMFSTGLYDIMTLQTKLKDMGLKNLQGGDVDYKTLYKLFRNTFYYGLVTWKNGKAVQGAHPPIITKALFDKVQNVLDKRSFKHKRSFVYIFQGLLTCPNCGKPLRSISSVKPNRYYKYYNCRSREHKFNLLEELVEEQFSIDLLDIEFSEEETQLFLTAIGKFREDLKNHRAEMAASFTFEINKIENRIELLMNDFLDQKVSNEDYNQMKAMLLNKKIGFTDKLASIQGEDTETIQKMENLGNLLKKPSTQYKTASEEIRRRLVKSLVENFSWNGKKIITNWKSECLPVANRDKFLDGSATENRTPVLRMKT